MDDFKLPDGPPPTSDEDVHVDRELLVLPSRSDVLFPGAVAPFDVGRENAVAIDARLGLWPAVVAIFPQKEPTPDDPGADALHPVGCAARVLKVLKHSSGACSLILQGIARVTLDDVAGLAAYRTSKIQRIEEETADDVEAEALAMSLRDIAKRGMHRLPREAASMLDTIQATGALADVVASWLDVPVEEKAQVLATVAIKDRLREVVRLLTRQLALPADPASTPAARVLAPPKGSRRSQASRRRRLLQRLKRVLHKERDVSHWLSVPMVVAFSGVRMQPWTPMPPALRQAMEGGEARRLGTLLPYLGLQGLTLTLRGRGKATKHTGKAARARRRARRLWANPPPWMGVALGVLGLGGFVYAALLSKRGAFGRAYGSPQAQAPAVGAGG